MRTRLILTIIGLGAVDLGLLIAVAAVAAHRADRDEVRGAEATDAGMRYSGPEIDKSTVVFRDAAESVAESADLATAAPTPSPVIRCVAARSMPRTAEPQPNGDGLSHRLRPSAGLSLRQGTPDAPPATDRKAADTETEPEAPEIVEGAAGQPLGVSRIHIRNPQRDPTWHAEGLNHHSSTFEEGAAHGYADLVRSTGECRHLNSLAMCNLQEAYSHALENRKKTVETYFELARINREERARQRGPRPTSEQLNRYARQRAPERLTSQEFDPACGTLAWPGLLQGPQFAAERSAIDRLMTGRSWRNGGNTGESATNVKKLVDGLKIKLKQQIKTLSPTEYVAAQKFLAGVEYEVYPRGSETGASARLDKLAAK